MKKFVCFVLTAVLCFGMSTTVFAANSPVVDNGNQGGSGSPEVTAPSGTTTIDGKEVTLTVQTVEEAMNSLSEKQQTEVTKVLEVFNGGDSAKTVELQKTLVKEHAGKTVEKIGYANLIDVALPAGQSMPSDGIKITINDVNVKATDNIVMLHMKADGTWENIAAVAGDGYVTGTFTSLSPVFYTAITEKTDGGSGDPTEEVPTTSPKTADNNMMIYVSLLAVAMAGAVYGTRKLGKKN